MGPGGPGIFIGWRKSASGRASPVGPVAPASENHRLGRQAMEESEDLLLSQVYAWQKALRVPIGELLAEPEEGLAPPVLKRARMVRLMKTASAIFHWSRQKSIRRLAQMLMEQLVELMPELAEVGPWPMRGRRRPTAPGEAAFPVPMPLPSLSNPAQEDG
jgi:hypothetical protein